MNELRAVSPDDLPIFFEQQRDPDALRMAAMPGRDHATFTMHWQTKVLARPSVIVRTIVHEGLVAGNINSFVASNRRCVGYFWERNIGAKGLRRRRSANF